MFNNLSSSQVATERHTNYPSLCYCPVGGSISMGWVVAVSLVRRFNDVKYVTPTTSQINAMRSSSVFYLQSPIQEIAINRD